MKVVSVKNINEKWEDEKKKKERNIHFHLGLGAITLSIPDQRVGQHNTRLCFS